MQKKILVVVLAVVATVLLADVAYIGTLLFANEEPTVSAPEDNHGAVSLYNPYNGTNSSDHVNNTTLGSPYNPNSVIPTLPTVQQDPTYAPITDIDATDAAASDPNETDVQQEPTSQSATPSAYSLTQVITQMQNAVAYMKSGKNFTAYKQQTGGVEITQLSIPGLRTPGEFILNEILESMKPLTYEFTNGTAVDPKTKETVTPFDVIPPSGESFYIDVNGVTRYNVTENADGSVTYSVWIREETCDLNEHPKYHSTCMGYLKLEQFDLKGVQIHQATVTYHEGQIDITVDKNGIPTVYREHLPMSGSGEGSLGISATASLTGFLEETWTFDW